MERSEGSQVKYDLVGKVAEGTHLTRRSVVAILKSISPFKFAMFKNNPEEFIAKAIRLINEEKATMIVDDITYNQTSGVYDSAIFTAEKNKDFSRELLSERRMCRITYFLIPMVKKALASEMDSDDKVVGLCEASKRISDSYTSR